MAWKFPKRKTRYDSPIDGEGLSENFHEFISEAGNLNEHNFSGDTTLSDKNVQVPYRTEEDAAVVVTYEWWRTAGHRIGKIDSFFTYAIDATPFYGDHDYVPPYGPRNSEGMATSSAKSIRPSPSWQSLKSITGTTQNSTLWIMSSFCMLQTDPPFDPQTTSTLDDGTIADGNAQFALRLNGVIIWETATMSASEDGDPIANRELHGPANLTLDALVPVTAGPFTLELIGRCTHDDSYAIPHLLEGDLVAIEFRR